MELESAKTAAKQRAQRENYVYVVKYEPNSNEPDWRKRFISTVAHSVSVNNDCLFFVSPKGKVTPIHHHDAYVGTHWTSFHGLKEDCPICHPELKGKLHGKRGKR